MTLDCVSCCLKCHVIYVHVITYRVDIFSRVDNVIILALCPYYPPSYLCLITKFLIELIQHQKSISAGDEQAWQDVLEETQADLLRLDSGIFYELTCL